MGIRLDPENTFHQFPYLLVPVFVFCIQRDSSMFIFVFMLDTFAENLGLMKSGDGMSFGACTI